MARADLLINQGDDYSTTIVVFDADGLPAQLTHDTTTLTNPHTAQAQIRRSNADADTTIDATFTCVVNPIGSRVTISLNAAQTLVLTNGPYVWDLQITDTVSNTKSTVAGGRVSIALEVTR